jgi:hypothetical protein
VDLVWELLLLSQGESGAPNEELLMIGSKRFVEVIATGQDSAPKAQRLLFGSY